MRCEREKWNGKERGKGIEKGRDMYIDTQRKAMYTFTVAGKTTPTEKHSNQQGNHESLLHAGSDLPI